MKVSYVSDLHLEFRDYPEILKDDPGGDVLILAGDIFVANYLRSDRTDQSSLKLKKMVKKLKVDLLDKYKTVLYVIGNHEHYHCIFPNTKKTIRQGLDDLGLIEKVIILDNDHIVLDGVPFIGATLWSDFLKEDDLSLMMCEKGMNDFHVIGSMDVDGINYFNKADRKIITPKFVLEEHKKSLEYFSEITKFYSDKKCVIISHHAPSYKSLNSMHSGNALDGAYASDLSEFILDRPQIKYWIHGHCHMNTDYQIGDCRVLSNQRGYAGEPSHRNFTGLLSFEIGK